MKDAHLTLMILAAGMGSRFGGLKQLTPVGPHGENLLDYSVYDALQAGFDHVVFIIKRAIEKEFREKVGRKIEKSIQTTYVFQELEDMPSPFSPPPGRTKPWGTGHAVWCALKQTAPSPFAVVNADDYYGRNAFKSLFGFLKEPPVLPDGKLPLAMVGYRLKNTLSENGSVSRGVCSLGEGNRLLSLTERTKIEKRKNGPAFSEDGGATWTPLGGDTVVSMNCWAFPAEIAESFGETAIDFFSKNAEEPKKEFYLPDVPDRLIREKKAEVIVLPTEEKWYGMTYAEDRAEVSSALDRLTSCGFYPEKLF